MKAHDLKKNSRTNWEKLSTIPDSKVDLSDINELGASFFANATLKMPEPKKAISLRIDSDILEWYKEQGTGYQTMINAVLRVYMQSKNETMRRPLRRKSRALNRVA